MDGQKYLAMLSCAGIKRGYTKDGEKIDTVSDSHSRKTCLSLQVQTSSKNDVSLYFHNPCIKMDKHDDYHAYYDILGIIFRSCTLSKLVLQFCVSNGLGCLTHLSQELFQSSHAPNHAS